MKTELHTIVMNAWDSYYRDYFENQLEQRLLKEGDVYVLYDIQIGGLQSFVELTRREGDISHIRDLVKLLTPAFYELTPVSKTDTSKGWVCNGGKICSDYHFIGKEVPLCSAQFLGLIGALATNIVENIPKNKRAAGEDHFLTQAFTTMAVQLNRWLTDGYFLSVEKRLLVGPENKTKEGGLFFTDRDLWYLTILSDLSELYLCNDFRKDDEGKLAIKQLMNRRQDIGRIFDLFLKRISIIKSKDHYRADLDKGMWSEHFDNRYANYTGKKPPVTWVTNNDGKSETVVSVLWDSTYLSPNAGWDISHARRLVPALETFVRNLDNIRTVWNYRNHEFDPMFLREAFANQIVDTIWNKRLDTPLFSNYWSGDNGWYRVAYANQTGRQFAGYPPYGLSEFICKGGYPLWGTFNPRLREIFKNIFFNYKNERMGDGSREDAKSKTSLMDESGLRKLGLSFLSDMIELFSEEKS